MGVGGMVDVPQRERITLCHECNRRTVNHKLAPNKYSMAGGCDHGSQERVGLDRPTELECATLADVRMYGVVAKVTTPSSGRVTQRALNGHFIAFKADGMQAAGHHMTKERIKATFKVCFVGPEGERDKLKSRAMLASNLQVDTRRIYNYLCVRRALHPADHHDDVHGAELPTLDQLDERLGGLTQELVDEAIIPDEKSMRVDQMFAAQNGAGPGVRSGGPEVSDDVMSGGAEEELAQAPGMDGGNAPTDHATASAMSGATAGATAGVRSGGPEVSDDVMSCGAEEGLAQAPGMDGGNAPTDHALAGEEVAADAAADAAVDDDEGDGLNDGIIFDNRAVWSIHNEDAGDQSAATVRGELESVRDMTQVVKEMLSTDGVEEDDDAEEAGEDPEGVRVAREREPVNEYTENDKLLYGAYWFDFLLKKGIRNVGSQTVQARRQVLLQFTNRFARNHELVFLLANQAQRHGHASGVAASIKSDKASFAKFAALVTDQDFQARLETAIANPTGQEAKTIMAEVSPWLVKSSKYVLFSTVARNHDVTKLMNIQRNCGTPSIFATISPDDSHHPLFIRFTIGTIKPNAFPATDEGHALPEALQNGHAAFTGKHGEEGGAMEFMIKLDNTSLGRRLASNPVAAAEVYNRMLSAVWTILLGIAPSHQGGRGSKKSEACESRPRGLFGPMRAAFGATEEQGRLALHHHLLGWGGLPPEAITKLFPRFAELVAECLDSMYTAEAPVEVHAADVMQRIVLPYGGHRFAHFESPSPTDPNFELWSSMAAVHMQHHEHHATCKCVPPSLPTLAL